MKIKTLIFAVFFLVAYFPQIVAQQFAVIHSQNEEIKVLFHQVALDKKIKNEQILNRKIKKLVEKCQNEGYFSFSVDSVIKDSLHYHLYVFEGEQFKNSNIKIDTQTKLLLDETHTSSYLINSELPFRNYPLLSEKIIGYLENRGYPFVLVSLDSMQISDNQLNAKLNIKKNEYIIFDSIILKGDANLKRAFLYPYFGLKIHQPYNESVIKKIPKKCKELSFVSTIQPSGIEFVVDKAYLYLFLNKKKMSSFDGYIGIVPEDEKSGKTLLAGEVHLNLLNTFGFGETMEILWKSPQRFSQQLKIHADIPYLFRTQFGISADFLLDKIDTIYLSMNYLVGIRYSFHNNFYIKTLFDYTSSSLLSPQFLNLENDILYADFRKTMYGFELYYRNIDYIFNPKKGIILYGTTYVGKRKILKNKDIPEEFYAEIENQKLQYRFQATVDGFIPLHRRWVVALRVNGGTLIGKNLVENELFKIGGLKTIRGFNENEILASSYLIGTSELRFLFAKMAYINLFFDGAYYEKNALSKFVKDFPFGFGLGVAFETKAGIFYLNYGLGKEFNNPIELKNGKINFGLLISF